MKTFKLFKTGLSVINAHFGKKSPLIVLNLITFRCNLGCKYCSLWKTKRNEMTTEKVKKAMREFANLGAVGWVFSGGEPLIRSDIGELIKYGKYLGLNTTLISNGLLVPYKINEIENLDNLILSLDGPKNVNDAIRGKGSYEKVLDAIKIAKNSKIKNIRLLSVISNENIKNNFYGIKELFKLAKKLNIELTLQPLCKTIYGDINEKYFPEKKMYLKAIRLIESYKKNSKAINITQGCLDILKKKYTRGMIWNCYAGRLFIYLFPDGVVSHCFFKEKYGINGSKYGFVNAFNKLPEVDNNCICFLNCHIEYNLLFNFNFESILKYYKSAFQK